MNFGVILFELSLAPATIGAVTRILTNREQEPGREEWKKFSICSVYFEHKRTLPRVDGEIGGQQAAEKVTTRSRSNKLR